jgi:uncharacterized protein YfkK (UPF0435 family)
MSTARELIVKIMNLEDILKARATHEGFDNDNYKIIREELLKSPFLKPKLPFFLETYEDLNKFWRFIKTKFPTYQERRIYIHEQLEPVIAFLEKMPSTPSDSAISEALAKGGLDYVHDAWKKALERRTTDLEGAITSARTLLEEVCKHILDKGGFSYSEKDDLPKLYKMTSEKLNLAPTQETDELIKRILGGCHVVTVGLGEFRNKFGDAHGKGKMRVKPNPLYAELAVNLAGTMATFLIASWEEE